MDWDYSFFIPRNNLFSKEGKNAGETTTNMLLVTETNRVLTCQSCEAPVGEISSIFYDIKQKHYCAICGSKLIDKEEEKDLQPAIE
jgi:hypothetical protein